MDISFYVLSFRVPLIISACPVRYNQIIIKIIIHIFQFFSMCYRIPANLFRMLFQDLSPSLISGECPEIWKIFSGKPDRITGRFTMADTAQVCMLFFHFAEKPFHSFLAKPGLICCKKYKCFRIVCFLQPVFYSPGRTVPAFR